MSKETSKAMARQPAPKADALEQQLLGQAKTPQERALAFDLASQARQADMIRAASIALAETGWGKDISPMSRAAVVRYCLHVGADPARHVYVLGGNIYLNANFWMELVAANPKFLRADTEFIHEDARASAEERTRRQQLRVQYGVPDEAKGAAIVTLYYEGERGPFIGVNFAGCGKKSQKYPDRFLDPIGEESPTKTAETRAYRRAAIKAEPAWFRKHPRLKGVTELVTEGRELASPDQVEADVVEAPVIETPAIQPVGVIERHQPSAVCSIEGDHPRETCGYYLAKKEPPA